MKICVFIGGLGNQMFEYAFVQTYIRKVFPNHKIYGVYNKKKLSEHHGLEIDKWFHVEMPPSKWWVDILTGMLYVYKKIFPKTKLLDLNQRECLNTNALLFYPSKFNKKYVPNNNTWLKWKVDEYNLSEENMRILESIRTSQSVFIHVRRGDYLSPKFKELFDGCCALSYYEKAIKYAYEQIPDLKFFCFSDDIPWVKKNLPLDHAVFVDCNKGTDSPLDMFLMSHCKAGIIANSTFSFWGARLGVEKKFICHPLKWINDPEGNFDIIPDEWIGFE